MWILNVTGNISGELVAQNVKLGPAGFASRDRVLVDPSTASVLEEIFARIGSQIQRLDQLRSYIIQ